MATFEIWSLIILKSHDRKTSEVMNIIVQRQLQLREHNAMITAYKMDLRKVDVSHDRIYKDEYMILCVNFCSRHFICTHVKNGPTT